MVKRANFGSYTSSSVAGETVKAYIPEALPPRIPLVLDQIYPLLDKATLALGRLDGISITVPDPPLFLYMYVRKEAVLSSQIEGTQSTLSDLLMYENKEAVGVPIQDVVEVSNYVAALEYGISRIESGFPLCIRLIKEMHEILLKNSRGGVKQTGEIRHSQNWIGGTRPGNAMFVPPPWERVDELLSDLEKFLQNENDAMPILVKTALAHVQFETIHPFLDGNGRLGRLLITFVLYVNGVLKKPLLYLSLYFKKNKNAYYNHLQLVREIGDWEEWLIFFLKGVIETADQAVETMQKIVSLIEEDRRKIQAIGKSAGSALAVFELLQKYPIIDSKQLNEKSSLTLPTINTVLKKLIKLKIVLEITGSQRNKIYKYHQYLNIMSEGID